MVLVELMQILALATWLAAIAWRATGHGPRRGRFAHQPTGPLGSAPRQSRSA